MPHVETLPIRLKKSSVPGKVPTAGQLEYGEIALNYADGILRFKTADNEIAAFPQARKTVTLPWAGTIDIDLLNGRIETVKVVLDGPTAFTFSNPREGQKFVVEVTQGVGGNKSYTWPATVRMTLGLQRSYSPSTQEGLMDRIGFIYTGSTYDLAAFSLGYTP